MSKVIIVIKCHQNTTRIISYVLCYYLCNTIKLKMYQTARLNKYSLVKQNKIAPLIVMRILFVLINS